MAKRSSVPPYLLALARKKRGTVPPGSKEIGAKGFEPGVIPPHNTGPKLNANGEYVGQRQHGSFNHPRIR
jgi:hypothetical protein